MTIRLKDAASNTYSQYGEDGILARMFQAIEMSAGFFVEFGATDGLALSNTRRLVELGWPGILIEADSRYVADLQRNCAEYGGVQAVECYVAPSGPNSLDSILDRCDAPEQIDLLSVDIDSDDLRVWMGMKTHRAVCVVIEYNPTIPFDTEFVNPEGKTWGNSALSIMQYAEQCGYSLVAVTDTNLILLDQAVQTKYDIAAVPLDASSVCSGRRYFWGYDGTMISKGPQEAGAASEYMSVPWHSYKFQQPMPRKMRGWHITGVNLKRERRLSLLAAAIARPISLWQYIREVQGRQRTAV